MFNRITAGFLVAAVAWGAATYVESVSAWRQRHARELQAEDGWLTVAGLFWLQPGDNPCGADEASAVRLPRGPKQAGVFHLENGVVSYLSEGSTRVLKPDVDSVTIGNLTLLPIQRNKRMGIRMRDPENPARAEFKGLHWFPVNEKYRIDARFEKSTPAHTLKIENVLGQMSEMASPGVAVFTFNGAEHRLDAVQEPDRLFFIFKDQTSGTETYPAGRFLYAALPTDGKIVLDFNRAENPPCAFTPYATCPLPPPSNRLSIRIEAGEKKFH